MKMMTVKKMKIKIKTNALDMYLREHTNFDGSYEGEDHWERILENISGTIIEVDTEMLFKHEFNTKPIKNISDSGIRVMEEYVEEIFNDLRYGKAFCELCEKVSNSDEVCTNCGREDYLDPFFDEVY